MIQGQVIATRVREEKVDVFCYDRYGQIAGVGLIKTPKSRSISEDDDIRWEGRQVYWTPKALKPADPDNGRPGIDYDIELERAHMGGIPYEVAEAKEFK